MYVSIKNEPPHEKSLIPNKQIYKNIVFYNEF